MNFLTSIFLVKILRITCHNISLWIVAILFFLSVQKLVANDQTDFFYHLSNQKKIDTLLQLPYDVLVENFSRSEKWLTESIGLTNDPLTKAKLTAKKSIISYYQGKYEQSTSENLLTIKLYDSLGLKAEAGYQYTQLGYQLKRINLEKGIMFMRKGMKIIESLNDSINFSSTYGNFGVLKEMQGEIDSALYYYEKSLYYSLQTQDSIGIPYAYNRMAIGYMLKGDYNRSVNAVFKSSAIRNKRNDVHGMVENESVLGDIYLHFKKYDLALTNYLKSLEGSSNLNYPYLVQENLYNISRCYAGLGDFTKAYENYVMATNMKDSLLNEKTNQQIAQVQEQFESIKKDKEILLLNRDNDINKANLRQKNLLVYTFSIGVILLLLLSFYIYRSYLIKKRSNKIIINQNQDLNIVNETLIQQKGIIEQKNKDIMASITYAKRIQSAILPPKKVINENLPENFIFYMPKDIVAGDFYWLETSPAPPLPKGEGDSGKLEGVSILFAAADCTGHGVPGAMVSVICNNGLNRSVREHGLTDPGKILDKTREIVIQEFEKSEEDVKDGMDIALCKLEIPKDKSQKTNLQYAGANNPLWIIRTKNENFELVEIKSNKQPIGKVDNPQPFTTHSVELQKGDTFYLFTDGFADQFGGSKGKKFMYKPFKELLLSIQEKTMEEQKIMLEQHFENWKGGLEQIDDVCVIGVRV